MSRGGAAERPVGFIESSPQLANVSGVALPLGRVGEQSNNLTVKRVLLLLAAAVALTILARPFETAHNIAVAAPLRLLCGSERWPVKTFADADRWKVDLTTRYQTVAQLNALPRPTPLPQNARVAGEFSVYRVTGTVTYAANEDDGDVHLAIRGADGSTLIAEAPEPACTANSRDRTAIKKARLVAQDIEVGDKVAARGVGFFDFRHNQIGAAKNQLELHPLLSLKRLGKADEGVERHSVRLSEACFAGRREVTERTLKERSARGPHPAGSLHTTD